MTKIRRMASLKEAQLRRYPMRQCSAKPQPAEDCDPEARCAFPHSADEETGVRNAKRQRANAVKTTPPVILNVVFQDRVQAFRHEWGQTVEELLNDAFQHFDMVLSERRQFELRDSQGAVCPSKGLVESLLLLQTEGVGGPETTLHLIKKTQQRELHQCWQYDPLKDLRKWRVDPAYAAKYESFLSDENGVITIASTQAVPVTEEHPIGILLTSKDLSARSFGRDTWTIAVSGFAHDSVEPDAYGAMVSCSEFGYLYDREKKVRNPAIVLDEGAYSLAGVTSSMTISYATMGFMWDCVAGTLMMFEVLPSGAWRLRRTVDASRELSQPAVYVRRRYSVERVITIKTGLPPPTFCLL